jgi:hypothetical protein
MRVAVSGGKPTLLRTAAEYTAFARPTKTVYVAWSGLAAGFSAPKADTIPLETFDGKALGVVSLPHMVPPGQQSIPQRSSSNAMLVVTRDAPEEVHVLSTDGGTPRVLRKGSPYDDIGGFLADGRPIINSSKGTKTSIEIVSPSGALKHVDLPDSVRFRMLTTDGSLAYWTKDERLGVTELATGKSTTFSTNAGHYAWDYTSKVGPKDDVAYVERAANGFELRVWSPTTNASRLIRAVAPADGIKDYAQHGQIAAYSVVVGDSTIVFVAGNSAAQPQRVAAVRGHTDGMSISRDGRRLAFGLQSNIGNDQSHSITFVELGADGAPAGRARHVPVVNLDGVTWLPNNKEVVYQAINGTDPMTTLMRLSAEEGAQPQTLSTSERYLFWDFSVSPDGKWISYPVDLPRRSTIWRVDFPGLPQP